MSILNNPSARRRQAIDFRQLGRSTAIGQVQVRGVKWAWRLISQHRPSLKSKHQVCVVQYLAVATCQVQHSGKVNNIVWYLFNNVMLRGIRGQGGFCSQLQPLDFLGAVSQAQRWRDWSCSSAEQGAVSQHQPQAKAEPSCLFALMTITRSKILTQSHRCQRERKPGDRVVSETQRTRRGRFS